MSTPTLNFKFTAVAKKRKATSGLSSPSNVQKLVGVVRIDENAHYCVRVYKNLNEHIDYEISQKSFTCKGKEIVWKFEKGSKRIVQIIRTPNNLCELSYHYKPFKPGSIVKGYINSLGSFEILKVKYANLEEYTRDDIIEKTSMLCYNDVIAAQKFYEEHLEEIQENYKLRYGTTE